MAKRDKVAAKVATPLANLVPGTRGRVATYPPKPLYIALNYLVNPVAIFVAILALSVATFDARKQGGHLAKRRGRVGKDRPRRYPARSLTDADREAIKLLHSPLIPRAKG